MNRGLESKERSTVRRSRLVEMIAPLRNTALPSSVRDGRCSKQSTVFLGRDVEESLACRGWCSPYLTGCLSLSDKRGISEVTVEQIEAAQKFFQVVTVQNLYNLVMCQSEDVLEYCQRANIGFIPWFPLAAGSMTQPGSPLDALAKEKHTTPSGIALAWILKRSPIMLPIPGTSQLKHLEENIAATNIELSDEEFQQLNELGQREWQRHQIDKHQYLKDLEK
ncbi:aldo/keto reductase [Ktedonobacter racemifer DSM 44963]|uniref:Aldo/keto reductase n=1 Tax=Ktedonobacter racemifer DSM 44963 TaxID=485913 RepID=D6TXQ4_KTERA|nr:aldo/keto reductase [Ktedonobacter racemifer DSM 44963]